MKRPLIMVLCTIVFIAAIVLTAILVDRAQESEESVGFMTLSDKGTVNNLLPMVYNGIVMILGIIFGFFYNRFSELQKQGIPQIEIKKEFQALFKATAFYLALAAAPVVFGIVVIASKGVSMGASLFLAFQNGFFWQSVMPKTVTPVTVPKPADPS